MIVVPTHNLFVVAEKCKKPKVFRAESWNIFYCGTITITISLYAKLLQILQLGHIHRLILRWPTVKFVGIQYSTSILYKEFRIVIMPWWNEFHYYTLKALGFFPVTTFPSCHFKTFWNRSMTIWHSTTCYLSINKAFAHFTQQSFISYHFKVFKN